ncbi:MAG TPA: DUF177 domain-containing protein, partial [Steroidobacteraceae bacterium]
MSRPPDEIGAIVDALVQAHIGGTIERRFQAIELPRLGEAGIVDPADIRVSVRCSFVEGRVALEGKLSGFVTMTCQRCMEPVKVGLADEFDLMLVEDEPARIAEEKLDRGYEPIVADPERFDMRWLAEEQILLDVPLVAKHEDVG